MTTGSSNILAKLYAFFKCLYSYKILKSAILFFITVLKIMGVKEITPEPRKVQL